MIADQPAPTETAASRAIWPLVVEDLATIIPPLDRTELVHPAHAAFTDHHNKVIELFRADMLERDRIGRERYGTPLKSHNGRKHLVDAYQEMLDGVVYLRAEVDECTDPARLISLTHLYSEQMMLAFRLRAMIEMRENPPTFGKPEAP